MLSIYLYWKIDTIKENDVLSNADQSINILDKASNNSYKLYSKFNQFEEMEYWSSESRTEKSDSNADQGLIQSNNTVGDILPIIRDNPSQAQNETKSIIDFNML